ncbi:MAG: DUF4350 domain-containing protein [Flavobacterium sp.]
MNRILVICGTLLVCLLALVFYMDAQKPRPVNWQATYGLHHKNPLGLYVFRQEAANIFKGEPITEIDVTPYEFFEPKYSYKDSTYNARGTFMYVDENIQLDRESVQELLYFADHGNTIFLSGKYFPEMLLDTLGIETTETFSLKDSVTVFSAQREKKFLLTKGSGVTGFEQADSLYTALAYQTANNVKKPNFITVQHGYGQFLLHTQPAAFSNYYLLKDDYSSYAGSILSYIPKGTVYWYSRADEKRISGSPLRFIMSQPALKSAFWIALLGLLVFILFNAKRRQRIVPEIPPVRNSTIDFTKTIGNLYYNSGDHHTTIDRMLVYFFERVRNDLKIDTTVLDEAFVEKLSQKSGKPIHYVRQLVTAINIYRVRTQSNEEDVIEISKAIENIML